MGCCESKSKPTENEDQSKLKQETDTQTVDVVQTSIVLHKVDQNKKKDDYTLVDNKTTNTSLDKSINTPDVSDQKTDKKQQNKTDHDIVALFSNFDDNDTDNDNQIENRTSIKRLIYILINYQKWINNDNINTKSDIFDYLSTKLYNKQYDVVLLLNDFLNVISSSNHSSEFEDIYLLITKQINCPNKSCKSLIRSNRDREKCMNDNSHRIGLYFGYNQSINFQNHLDRIHCYFLHSFDRSLKLRRSQLKQIQDQINKPQNNSDDDDDDDGANNNDIKTDQNDNDNDDDDDEQNDQNTLQMIQKVVAIQNKDNQSQLNKNKFVSENKSEPKTIVTDVDDDDDDANDADDDNKATDGDNKDDDKEKEEEKPIVYSFGYRYFYWDYYKDNIHRGAKEPTNYSSSAKDGMLMDCFKDWYIGAKYNSFKEELLNNNIKTISAEQWNDVIIKADNYLQTNICKQLAIANWDARTEPDYSIRYEESGIKLGDIVSIHHLTSIILYTDFDYLQRCFTATYRKLNDNETNDMLKERHSNYAIWGKYLRECVEVFGLRVSGKYKDPNDYQWKTYKERNKSIKIHKKFYHGINAEMYFVATIGRFAGPTSTTISITIAVQFSKESGLCLQLGRTGYDSALKYFDCSWISHYTHEQEMLFIGGYAPIKFKTIINTKIGVNYRIYLRALNQLNFMLTGTIGTYFNKQKQLIRIHTTQKDALVIYKLINHLDIKCGNYACQIYGNKELKKEIPQYIQTLFKFYCDNLDHIKLDLSKTFMEYKNLSNIFIKGTAMSQYGANRRTIMNFNFELLCKLFKNIKIIEIKDTKRYPQFNNTMQNNNRYMSGDNRFVLKKTWLEDMRWFFQSDIMRKTPLHNTNLSKIIFHENVFKQCGDVTVDELVKQHKHAHLVNIGKWRLYSRHPFMKRNRTMAWKRNMRI